MDYIIDFSIALCLVMVGIGVMLVANYASKFLKEKANASFDASRNNKVNSILNLIEVNIATAITNYLSDRGYANIDEKELREAVDEISESVTNMTGKGVVGFITATFADDWDEWVVSKVKESISRRAKYENK